METEIFATPTQTIPAGIREAAAARIRLEARTTPAAARNMAEAAAFVLRRLADVRVEDLVATVYRWIDFEPEANRARSEATREQPRTEDGTRLASGAVSRDTAPDNRSRNETADKTGVSPATAARAEATKEQPRDDGGLFASGAVPRGTAPDNRSRNETAEKAGVSPRTAGRAEALANARPDLATARGR